MASGFNRRDRRRKSFGFPAFITGQLAMFFMVSVLVVSIDLAVLAVAVGVATATPGSEYESPFRVANSIDDALTLQEDGTYSLTDYAVGNDLTRRGFWAMLVSDETGETLWEMNAPEDAQRHFTLGDMARFARSGYVGSSPAFFWQRDEGVLMIVAPSEEYVNIIQTLPASEIARIPLFLAGILVLNLVIVFVYVVVSHLSTQRSIRPLSEALEDLSEGKPVSVSVGGRMGVIGQTLNEASAIMREKDRARELWIRGVSHDIRTPLSVITGRADKLSHDLRLPEDARTEAALVRTQGLRIKDLVNDLNAAARLEYDTQPLNKESVALPSMLRGLVSEYLNGGLPSTYELGFQASSGVGRAEVTGDVRLLYRAVQNAVQNSMNHNPQGCGISLTLDRIEGTEGLPVPCAVIAISDDGVGVEPEKLALLQQKIDDAQKSSKLAVRRFTDSPSPAGAPEPPLGFLFEQRVSEAADHKGVDPEHGLGLQLVARIAAAHGGRVRVYAPAAGGFAIAIFLPLD